MNHQTVVVGRPLGALEEIIWFYDQWTPFHFVMAFEVTGETQPEDWRMALDALQERHPLLSVRIGRDGSTTQFYAMPTGRIPLRLVPNDGLSNWQQIAAEELYTPFDPAESPLLRVAVMHSDRASVLIFAVHHSIADGISIVLAVRDLLEALSGIHLQKLTVRNSQEEMLGLPDDFPNSDFKRDGTKSAEHNELLLKPRQINHQPALLHSLRLSSDLTQQLSHLARRKGTTVHAILCAALILVGRESSNEWANKTIRLLSPVNIRGVTGVKEDILVNFANAITATPTDAPTDLIELARSFKSALTSAASPQSLGEVALRIIREKSVGLDIPSAARFMLDNFTSDAMVTNLGVLPIPTKIGAFTIDALWGPAVMTGIPGEQIIGVATVNGSMCLLHSSYAPFPSLLERIEALLTETLHRM